MSVPCPECPERFSDRDYLVDHLTDAHGAFQWVTAGRPVDLPQASSTEGSTDA